MLRIDDKDPTPVQMHAERPPFRPVHRRLRIYANDKPLWEWRGILFSWNKRRVKKRIA